MKNIRTNNCWIPEYEQAPLNHIYFRKEFEVDGIIRAEICLYASTLYHLYINGEFVGVGPVRSYPEFSFYDTYDLIDYIKPGKNVIAVNVVHHGMTTFHHLYKPGGFAAAGRIETADGRNISLDSPSGWMCRLSEGYKRDAQKFSFAIGPVQVFDERKEFDWKGINCDTADWEKPVRIELPENWKFFRRPISHLSDEEILVSELLGAYKNSQEEEYYNLTVIDQKSLYHRAKSDDRLFAGSYIFSPREQWVDFGCWWGEYFVNGERVSVDYDEKISFRQKGRMYLKKGWNCFVFSVGLIKISYELHLGFPKNAGLVVSALRSVDCAGLFMVAHVNKAKGDAVLKILESGVITDFYQLSELDWQQYVEPEIPDVSAKYLSWIRFEKSLDVHDTQNIVLEDESTLIFDMGGISLGRIFIEYDAPAGTMLSIAHSEELSDQRPDLGRHVMLSSVEGHICSEGRGVMETFEPRGFRYLQVTVSDNNRPVIIRKVGIKAQLYPYTRKGSFECSDSDFNKLYEWGYRTLCLCSEDVITDCPSRERTLYGGDLFPEAATAMVTTGDLRLVRHSIEVFLESQNEKGWLQSSAPQPRDEKSLFDYPPLVLINTQWYCRLTDDQKFAQRAYPVFSKMMQYAVELRNDVGLYSDGYRPFIAHGYKFTTGTVTAFNALMVETFRAWGRFLKYLQKDYEAETAFSIADNINDAILKHLWKTGVGFIDGIDEHGVPAETSGTHANFWMQFFADVDQERWALCLQTIKQCMNSFSPYNENHTVSPYNAFYYLGALYKAGETRYAENSIRKIYKMMLENPTGTIWEHANPSKSLCHAWSTAPNFYFATRILGVQLGLPEETDLSKITISPEAETVTWAKGAVMHPLGKVYVHWKIDGDQLLLYCNAPSGKEVVVKPKGKLADKKLILNMS